jgi:hypothetical protein
VLLLPLFLLFLPWFQGTGAFLFLKPEYENYTVYHRIIPHSFSIEPFSWPRQKKKKIMRC